MTKQQVIDILVQIGEILEIKGENPFKTRAYFNGARALESLTEDLPTLVEEERLDEIPGFGKALQEKVTELIQTGKMEYYEELRQSIPSGLLELLEVQGIGPKKVKVFYDKLKITNLNELEKACREGKVADLDGMGEKTQKNILENIEQHRSYQDRHRYGEVFPLAEKMVEQLKKCPEVIRISIAGSLRRGKEIIKDIDLLVSSEKPEAVMNAFVALPKVQRVTGHGETKSSVILEGGINCDLRVVSDEVYPYALHHFTGSKEHNVAMRQRAISQGKKMSEWGLFDTSHEPEKLIPCKTEEDLFKKLGLHFIPPELRENLGEIDFSEKNTLPRLIELKDLKGCFHNHTTASDGLNSLEQMAQAAQDFGLEYLGIADHSKSSVQANGLSEERLLKQVEEINAWNKREKGIHLFAGVECDILKDGSLDYSDDILKQLDYVVASIHQSFQLPEKEMTARIIRAMENPYVTMIGHVTGRILLKREGYEVDLNKVIDAAVATGTWIELNAQPKRLDMDWRWWKIARDKGVKCVINPDAHHINQIAYLSFGIKMARKGWLRSEDVVNTLSIKDLQKQLG